MILLLKTMDELHAGLGWSNVHDFLENVALMDTNIKEELSVLIPKESELNFNHFVEWFDSFNPSDICFLLRRRAACIMQRNQDSADLLIPFFIRGGEIKFGAIVVQIKNWLEASDTKQIGQKLFVSSVFEHWDERDHKIPFFGLVLELGLSLASKIKPRSIPMANEVDLVAVSVTRDQDTRWGDGEAAFIVKSSDSLEDEYIVVREEELHTVKEGKVKFLRLRGIAGVPWMDEATYDGFIELLEGRLAPRTVSTWTEGVDTTYVWKEGSIFSGLKKSPTDR
jgi:hypothetical protein